MAPLSDFLATRAAFAQAAPRDAGRGLCHALSDAMDATLRAALAPDRPDVALVAVGGYGRRELCLHSDIDLMLLYRGRVPDALTRAIFYPLWDARLKVGHAVRTVAEALTAADDRLETLTALLDLRFVCGSEMLVDQLAAGLAGRVARRHTPLSTELRQAVAARRAAEPYQLLATNLKDGHGGLRTRQRLGWLQAIAACAGDAGLPAAADSELPGQAAYQVVLAARNALHAAAGRVQDTWLAELQPAACAWLGVEPDPWCVRLYLALREIDRLFDEPGPAERPLPPRGRVGRLLSRRAAPPAAGDAMPPRADSTAAKSAAAGGNSVLQYAGALARRGEGQARLSPEAAAEIGAAPGASWTEADRAGLLALLASGERGLPLLEDLARLGWLERSLPEWRHLRGAPQHTPFHLHPVDVHLWRTVAEAVALAEGRTGERWCREVADDLGGLDDLLLAALLHDIGKGWPGDHAQTGAAAAAAFCRRARFHPDVGFSVSAAVQHHLLLPQVATRRDIADERVVAGVADQIGRVHTLRMLYLLSVADSRATGPAVWSPWKASLVHDLYSRVLRLLEARGGATPLTAAAPDALEHLLAATAGRFAPDVVLRHATAMPPGYTRAFGADDVLRHLAVMDPAPEEGSVRIDVHEDGAGYDLALAVRDRPGLISLVAGVLALHNLSVLEGRFFTRDDGVALQALRLVDTLSNLDSEDRWRRIAADVERALRGELPLEQRLEEKVRAYRRGAVSAAPADVRVEPAPSGRYTVLEVHATDRAGLLYSITRALYGCGLDVHFAKIDTQGAGVVDVFYVCDLAGQPLRDGERLRAVRATLQAAIAG